MTFQPQLTQLLQELISVTDDDRPLNGQVISRSTIFERTERFIQCSRKVDEVDNTDDQGQPRQPTQFVPPLTKGQLIKAKFSAVGSELDREHFAIVWDAIPNRDSIQYWENSSFITGNSGMYGANNMYKSKKDCQN
ncbi:hypothetical protein RhiirA1_482271 [Rhizophagus irregularis]|uniref:Uncharacterized protein n=1 Tax=Rhizophagus irregularis TaxID=588596 RepID=A0A2N0QM22_9GLOM|nr:hypothetical protein RhiirA1_482271 [Rhizophagus irregularis]